MSISTVDPQKDLIPPSVSLPDDAGLQKSTEVSKSTRCKVLSVLAGLVAAGVFLTVLFLVILKKPAPPTSGYVPADPFHAIPKSIGTTATGARIFEQDVQALNHEGFPLSFKYQAELSANVFSIEEFHRDHPTMRIQVHECEPERMLVEFDAATTDNSTSTFVSSSLRLDNVLVGGAQHKCAAPSAAEKGFYRKIVGVQPLNTTVYETTAGPYEKSFYALQTAFVTQESCFEKVKLDLHKIDSTDNYRVEPDAAGHARLVETVPVDTSAMSTLHADDYDVIEHSSEVGTFKSYTPKQRGETAFSAMNICAAQTSCGACSNVIGCGWCSKTRTCISETVTCDGQLFSYTNECPTNDRRLVSQFTNNTIVATGYIDRLDFNVYAPDTQPYKVDVYQFSGEVRCSPADRLRSSCTTDAFLVSSTLNGTAVTLDVRDQITLRRRYLYITWADGKVSHSNTWFSPDPTKRWVYITEPVENALYSPTSVVRVKFVYSAALQTYDNIIYLYYYRRYPGFPDSNLFKVAYYIVTLSSVPSGAQVASYTVTVDMANEIANPAALPSPLATYFYILYTCPTTTWSLGCADAYGNEIFFPYFQKEYNWNYNPTTQRADTAYTWDWSTGSGSTPSKALDCSMNSQDLGLCQLQQDGIATTSTFTCTNCYMYQKTQFNRLTLTYDDFTVQLLEVSFNTTLDVNFETLSTVDVSYTENFAHTFFSNLNLYGISMSIAGVTVDFGFRLDLGAELSIDVQGRGTAAVSARASEPNTEYIARYGSFVPNESELLRISPYKEPQKVLNTKIDIAAGADVELQLIPTIKFNALNILKAEVKIPFFTRFEADFQYPAFAALTGSSAPRDDALIKFGSCVNPHYFEYNVFVGVHDITALAVLDLKLGGGIINRYKVLYNDTLFHSVEKTLMSGCFIDSTANLAAERRVYFKPVVTAGILQGVSYQQRLLEAISAATGVSKQRVVFKNIDKVPQTVNVKLSSTSTHVMPMATEVAYMDVVIVPQETGSEPSSASAMDTMQESASSSSSGPLADIESFSWSYSAWSTCDCNDGTQTRTAQCVNSSGQSVDPSFCDSATLQISQQCTCTYTWSYGPWSACGCASGIRTRKKECLHADGTAMPDSFCTYDPNNTYEYCVCTPEEAAAEAAAAEAAKGNSSNIGMIAGIAGGVGGVALIIIIAVTCYCLKKKKSVDGSDGNVAAAGTSVEMQETTIRATPDVNKAENTTLDIAPSRPMTGKIPVAETQEASIHTMPEVSQPEDVPLHIAPRGATTGKVARIYKGAK